MELNTTPKNDQIRFNSGFSELDSGRILGWGVYWLYDFGARGFFWFNSVLQGVQRP